MTTLIASCAEHDNRSMGEMSVMSDIDVIVLLIAVLGWFCANGGGEEWEWLTLCGLVDGLEHGEDMMWWW